MTQIKRIKSYFLATLLTFSFMSAFLLMPGNALAAGCNEQPTSDTQGAAQEECVKRFINQCERDFPNRKQKCQSLTVEQINECAADGGRNKLRENCFTKLEIVDDSNTQPIATSRDENDCVAQSGQQLDGDNCGVIGYVLFITNVLSGLAATIIVIMMIVGGIQYSMAGADASKVQAAKQKIYNALIALILFIFGFGIVQWLVPGGLF